METINFKNHFSGTKNWSFNQNDAKAEIILAKFQQSARKQMPHGIYSSFVMTHYEQMKKHKLYSLMKTIPKGSLHHCHIDCCQDKQYYRKYIINDPITYLSEDLKHFKVGTKKQAQQQKWVSMEQLRQKFQSQQQMVDFVSNITMLNKEDNRKVAAKQVQFWPFFTQKIISFFSIMFAVHHFKTYIKYICQKFIYNGYDRLQFRSMLQELTQYDTQGNIVKKHEPKKYMDVLDEVYDEVKKQHPNFSFGVIFFGLKMFTPEQNQQIFTKICQLNWDKTIGFDLVQQQDAFGSQQPYDNVVTKVLNKYQHLNYKKVYHAGQTKNPLNNNIQIAIKAGSVRIGHGINIIQRLQYLPQCKDICFEINHISNVLTGLRDDTRITSAPVLMGLGHPITINPDDPGKFGYEDTTVDYFSAFISFNWSLKELKLLGIHSINHSICSQQEKVKLLSSFTERWNAWIKDLIQKSN